MFSDVIKAVHSKLKSSVFLDYVKQKDFFLSPGPTIASRYALFLEPILEEERENKQAGGIKHIDYIMQIYAGIAISGDRDEIVTAKGTNKSLLDFIEDIKKALRVDLTLGLNRVGTSISQANATTSYVLTANVKYISVSINGATPSGYDSIDCGSSTLSGTQIAINIQASLRSLGNSTYVGDPYNTVTCTYSTTERKFTITSSTAGAGSSVVVDTGVTDDASVILKFNRPTELRGRTIISTYIPKIQYFIEDVDYPVRYAQIGLNVSEETWIS